MKKSHEKFIWNNFFVINYTKNNHEWVNVEFINTSHVWKHTCQLCQQIFYFNNKLHRYMHTCRKLFSNNFIVAQYINVKTLKKNKNVQITLWERLVVALIILFDKIDEYEFRNWKYVTIKITIAYRDVMKNLCFDIEYTMSLMNKKWFYVLNFNIIICQIVNSIKMREIDDREHFNFDYVNLNIYLKNKLEKNRQSFIYKKTYIWLII